MIFDNNNSRQLYELLASISTFPGEVKPGAEASQSSCERGGDANLPAEAVAYLRCHWVVFFCRWKWWFSFASPKEIWENELIYDECVME